MDTQTDMLWRSNCWPKNVVALWLLWQPAMAKCAKATTQHVHTYSAHLQTIRFSPPKRRELEGKQELICLMDRWSIVFKANVKVYACHALRFTHTAQSIPALTVTDPLADKTSHASRRAWFSGVSSFLRAVPQIRHAHIYAPHTPVMMRLKHWTHSVQKSRKKEAPLHPNKCRHFLSCLTPPSPLPQPLSFSQQPHSQSDGRWHHAAPASAEAGLSVCGGKERKGDPHKSDTEGILTGLLCVQWTA